MLQLNEMVIYLIIQVGCGLYIVKVSRTLKTKTWRRGLTFAGYLYLIGSITLFGVFVVATYMPYYLYYILKYII